MDFLTSVLIVAALAGAPIDPAHWDGTTIFRADFAADSDTDADSFPDGWLRRHGPGFPHYLPIEMVPSDDEVSGGELRIELDGGAAALYSPPIEIDPRRNYLLTAQLRTERLRHDEAWYSLSYFDADRQPLITHNTHRWRAADDWQPVALGPIDSPPTACYAVIGLHLEPAAPEQADLSGSATFDDIALVQLPRLTLTTGSARVLQPLEEPLEVECRATGLTDEHFRVLIELFDAEGELLAEEELPLRPSPHRLTAARHAPVGESLEPGEALLRWSVPIQRAGYYRVRVTLPGAEGIAAQTELPLAIVESTAPLRPGAFGWSFVEARPEMSDAALVELLRGCGVGWVKLPLWHAADDALAVRRSDRLVELLYRWQIDVIGVLAEPPPSVLEQLPLVTTPSAASVLRQKPELWYPSVQPLLMRYLFRVPRWQLGADGDLSFVGYAQSVETVTRAKQQLDQIGQDLPLGIGWAWDVPQPTDDELPWDFVSLTSPAGQSAEELAAALSTPSATPRWVNLEPLSREEADASRRAADLVLRMVAAQAGGDQQISVSRPLDAERGLLHINGTPTELLLPWRTAVANLAGAEFRASMHLPNDSTNAIIRHGEHVAMVAWSESPRREALYLGDEVRVQDVWGHSQPAEIVDGRQVIDLGPTPVFLHGLHPAVTRWRQAVALDRHQVPSVLGRPHRLTVELANTFDAPVHGTVRFVSPDGWRIEPREFDIRLQPGQRHVQPLRITLPLTASTGRRPLWLQFNVTADRPYDFAAYEHIQVGSDDVTLDVTARLNEQGQVEVRQRLVNNQDDPVTFRCYVFVPNRVREMWQVVDLPRGLEEHVNVLEDGADLVGQTVWVRAQEADGNRTLSQRVVVEAQ